LKTSAGFRVGGCLLLSAMPLAVASAAKADPAAGRSQGQRLFRRLQSQDYSRGAALGRSRAMPPLGKELKDARILDLVAYLKRIKIAQSKEKRSLNSALPR